MKNLSIRAKVAILFVTLFLVLSSTFSLFMYNYLSQILYRTEENIIKDETIHILNHLAITDEKNDYEYDFGPLKLLSPKTGIIIFDTSGNILYGETDSGIAVLPIEKESFREFTSEDQRVWIFFDEPVYFKEQVIGWLRVSRSVSHIIDTLNNIRMVIFTATPIYVLFASISSLFLTTRALIPIDNITRTANIIEKGDLSKRITIPKVNDEVGRLARTFNKMIERIEKSFKKEKRFTSDASHELKTPISIISATAEQALEKGSSVKDHKKALVNIINESKNLSYLISQLLFLARNDEGKEVLNLEEIDLAVIAESVVSQLEEMAEKKDIKISMDLEHDFKLKADQTLITMLFLNIIENSIKYNKPGGFINISLLKKENHIKILFEDSGIGISDEDMPYVFDRFYQVNRARTGKGSGLGLAISKEIIELHNGEINIESLVGRGTKVEILLLQDPLTEAISNTEIDHLR